jgi:hypothetical protein
MSNNKAKEANGYPSTPLERISLVLTWFAQNRGDAATCRNVVKTEMALATPEERVALLAEIAKLNAITESMTTFAKEETVAHRHAAT